MAFITEAGLKTRVQATLKQFNLADVSSSFDVHIADSVEAGYQEIVSAFLDRGLTKAQADSWARGPEFNIDLGLFWTFTKAAGLHDVPDTWIVKLDRRAELQTVFLADLAGEPIVPDPEAVKAGVGQVGHGVIKRHPLDNFTVPGSRGRAGEGAWKPT